MTNDRGVGVGDGSQETLGLRLPVQLEAAMDARHNEIEAFEHLVRVVERSIREDVGFDALQDPEIPTEGLVQPVGLPVLLLDLLD